MRAACVRLRCGRRFVVINNHTFEAGEETEIPVSGVRTRIHCLEIREDSVLLEVAGVKRELRLKQRF